MLVHERDRVELEESVVLVSGSAPRYVPAALAPLRKELAIISVTPLRLRGLHAEQSFEPGNAGCRRAPLGKVEQLGDPHQVIGVNRRFSAMIWPLLRARREGTQARRARTGPESSPRTFTRCWLGPRNSMCRRPSAARPRLLRWACSLPAIRTRRTPGGRPQAESAESCEGEARGEASRAAEQALAGE